MTQLNHALMLPERAKYFEGTLSYPNLQTMMDAFHSTIELYLNMVSDKMYLGEVISCMEAERKGAQKQVKKTHNRAPQGTHEASPYQVKEMPIGYEEGLSHHNEEPNQPTNSPFDTNEEENSNMSISTPQYTSNRREESSS